MNLKKRYQEKVIPEIKTKFNLGNSFEVPKIKKVVVNVGIGKFLKDSNAISEVTQSLKEITGQKPVMTKSKKSIAGFKTRQGLEIGIKITLRGKRMWDFLERFVGSALPRVRDFRGLKETCVDANGNLNIGVKEQLIFPEVQAEKVKTVFGMQINVTSDAGNRERGLELFRSMGFPIKQAETKEE